MPRLKVSVAADDARAMTIGRPMGIRGLDGLAPIGEIAGLELIDAGTVIVTIELTDPDAELLLEEVHDAR